MSEKNRVIGLTAILESVKTRKGDKSLLLTLATQEMSMDKEAYILHMRDRHIYFFMSEAMFDESQVVEAMPEPVEVKQKKGSKSQKLRNTLFKLHQFQGGEKEDFNDFYDDMMEKIIKFYSDKANQL